MTSEGPPSSSPSKPVESCGVSTSSSMTAADPTGAVLLRGWNHTPNDNVEDAGIGTGTGIVISTNGTCNTNAESNDTPSSPNKKKIASPENGNGDGNESVSRRQEKENDDRSNDNNNGKNNDNDNEDIPVPKFQPGDHVIRWKVIKIMLWPIQIHGIVLESNVQEDGTCSVVIADFGYSSSQQNSKKGGSSPTATARGKKGIMAINEMMNSFYKKKERDNSENAALRREDTLNDQEMSAAAAYATDDAPSPVVGDDDEVEEEELADQNGKRRFHLRTITDPNDLKKWSKVNYGASLFSSKGKFNKLKKFFTLPQLKKGNGVVGDGKGQYESTSTRSFEADDDSYFSHGGAEIEMNDAAKNKASNGDGGTVMSTSDQSKQDLFAEADRIIDSSNMTPLEQLIAQANEIDRKSRSRNRFYGFSSSSSVTSVSSSSSSLQPPSSVSSTRRGGGRNFLKKFSLKNLKSPTALISPKNDNYASLSTTGNNTFEDDDYGDDGSGVKESANPNKEEPKLPKSDPRKIVLARVKFVLAEQDKPESDSYLPPYHILYSNSECLAVWCKTGKFSTLQAAVFLHSTAVGNAKSTIMLTAGIAATQPWLIPVVGMYGLVAVGMPYYVLNKCKNKWKVGEQRLTNGFWDQASNDVIVCAIENWSGLTPDKQENSDEK